MSKAPEPQRPPQRLLVTALTHRGARRKTNEDCVSIGTWRASGDMDAPVQRLVSLRAAVACAVADGLGGHDGGALASQIVLARLGTDAPKLANAANITAFVRDMGATLRRLGEERGFPRAPGTTLAALICPPNLPGKALAANIGDSRIYRLSHRGAERLSEDDTTPTEGADTDDRTGTQGHGILQAIGGGTAAQRLAPHILETPLAPGVRYLLCSDGLTDVVGLGAITALALHHHDDDSAMVQALFDAAMAAGGPDNISLCLIRPMA